MTKKYDKLCTVEGLDTNFLIFVETNLDTSEAGVFYVDISEGIYTQDECKDFDDNIQKYKKEIFLLGRDENVLLIKAKGNGKALIVASTVKTPAGIKATLDVMTTTNPSFKRCKEQTYDGEITGLDVSIFSPDREAACMIYSLKKSEGPGEDCIMCYHG